MQRSWNADDEGADLAYTAEVARSRKAAGMDDFGDGFGRDMLDIALALVERIDLAGIDVKAQHGHAGTRELERQWQTDIS